MFQLTLFCADVKEDKYNCRYPHRQTVADAAGLQKAVQMDHVCATYRDDYRSIENFVESDCLPLDVDNDHTEDPGEWITPAAIENLLGECSYAIVFSRNHMKPKKGKAPRPKFHVLFSINTITDAILYAALKAGIQKEYSFFDYNVRDSARFFFGSDTGEPIWHEGFTTIDEIIEPVYADAKKTDLIITLPEIPKGYGEEITQGGRNATMHRIACRLLKRYGDSEEALKKYASASQRCNPPLEEKELNTVYAHARKWYLNNVANAPGYIPPEEYEKESESENLKPDDYTDLGQAAVFVAQYGDLLRYSTQTDYMKFDGIRWKENVLDAQRDAQLLTDRQLVQARKELREAQDEETAAEEESRGVTFNPLEGGSSVDEAEKKVDRAKKFHSYVLGRRKTAAIGNVLKAAQSMLQIDVKELDSDPFALNTPGGTVDLRTRQIREHRPEDYCTKVTAVAPGDKGSELYEEFLDRVTCGDSQVKAYLQIIAGMCAVGKVFCENLIIAEGSGGNGKSTLFNLWSMVLGDYSGSLSAETLTVNCRKNKSPEYAELRGKRLVLAAELEEGMRLDTAVVKKLCSTDQILAERKYKDPFTFTPSHTTILFTNHLPKVGTNDNGTWARLIVIPFRAKLRGSKGEIKNYAEYLFENCGEAVLSWIIKGAQAFISNNYKVELPERVKRSIEAYREDNDWVHNFVNECCETGNTVWEYSSVLYEVYQSWCAANREYCRGRIDFKQAMESAGYSWEHTRSGNVFWGLETAANSGKVRSAI